MNWWTEERTEGRTDGRADRRMDGKRDRPAEKDGRAHLKKTIYIWSWHTCVLGCVRGETRLFPLSDRSLSLSLRMLRLWSKVKSGQLGLYSSICLESVNVRRQVLTVERKKTATNARPQVGFICAQLLNKLSKKVLVAQILKEIERALKPEQPGLSSSIRLEVIRVQRWVRFFSRVEKKAPPPLPQKPISTNLSPFIMSWD